MTHSTPDDDFDHYAIPARSRRGDPDTSRKAARKVEPHTPSIRDQVDGFAKHCGSVGFIDEELSDRFGSAEQSSYRTRRAELADQNIILDSGKRRFNKGMNECIVWVHRDHHPNPPLVLEGGKSAARSSAISDALAMAPKLARYAAQMKAEGRSFLAAELDEAAEIMRRCAE